MVIVYVVIAIVAGTGTFFLFHSNGLLLSVALAPLGASIAAFVAALVLHHRASRRASAKGVLPKKRSARGPKIAPPLLEHDRS